VLGEGKAEGFKLGCGSGEYIGEGSGDTKAEETTDGTGLGFVVVSHDATPRVVHRTKICAYLSMGQFPIRERERA